MAAKSKQALGKGLAALIPSGTDGVDTAMGLPGSPFVGEDGTQVHNTAIDKIIPSPFQPRHHFTPDQLTELVNSIREHGIIQPLIVRQVDDKLELIAGERRWRASKALGLKEVPVIIRKANDQDVLEWALVENLQREDLNPIEEAAGYVRLAREFNLRQDQIAERVGKNRASVANAIRLLDLHPDIQSLLAERKVSVGHAKVILSVKNKEKQLALALDVIKKNLSVRQTEKTVKVILNPPAKVEKVMIPQEDKSREILNLETLLSKTFTTKVGIIQSSGCNKGKLEIAFADKDDLRRILELLGMEQDHLRFIS